MTTPAQPQQQPYPPGQQPPQQQGTDLDNPALAVAIASVLADAVTIGGLAVSAAVIIAMLKMRFKLPGAAWRAMRGVFSLVLQSPPAVTGVIGPASAQVGSVNAARRAQYVIAASKRVQAAEEEARAKGQPVEAARASALAAEQRYYSQHQAAMWKRATAAGQTDIAAATYGDLLGWNSMRDDRVSPECKKADGCNYYASSMPDIGYPGGVHIACRCYPSSPHQGARLLPSSRAPGYARAA